MKSKSWISNWSTFIALFLVAGCASGSSGVSVPNVRTGFDNGKVTDKSSRVHKHSSLDSSLLYVSDESGNGSEGSISVYSIANNYTLKYTITNGIDLPQDIGVSPTSDDLFVVNDIGPLTVYGPGGGAPLYHIDNPTGLAASAVAVGSQGNAYVSYIDDGTSDCGSVKVFPPGSKTASDVITDGICGPSNVALDSSNNLYVVNYSNLTIYSPNPRTLIATVPKNGYWLAFDSGGLLLTALPAYRGGSGPCKGGFVDKYNATWTKVVRTLTAGAACDPQGQIALDSNNNLFVPGGVNLPEVSVFAPGNQTPTRNLTQGLNAPTGVAIDSANNVYVQNLGGPVVVFPPGSNTPLATITNGIHSPDSMAIY
jgi:hypothetical protein